MPQREGRSDGEPTERDSGERFGGCPVPQGVTDRELACVDATHSNLVGTLACCIESCRGTAAGEPESVEDRLAVVSGDTNYCWM